MPFTMHSKLHSAPSSTVRSVRNTLAFSFSVFVAAGCATADIREGLIKVSEGVQEGINKVTTKGPGSANNGASDALAVVSKYPLNEAPHTLMKKPVAEGRLTSGHGYRFSPTGVPIPKKHKGVDYSAPAGTPVYAAGNGTITKLYESKSYGNYIRIAHENDFFTAYAHMQAFADGLDVGSAVTKGQIIGNVGSTGRSSGNHLHFELLHKSSFIDPLFEYTPATVQSASQ
ncbi:M23 family metallopeptidase [Granulosicoccus antarcticus]|uniref:Murein DD-endopeptidase MepM n=1 Tax=Granulosicoccus antarcticus IMCC3135 TaxID=1192854 RepID=A0A2Z2NLC6_9GAMM|nr:M23 family metallopeptidase [Granulosicoccus antarcticus]ASJ70781.1 Murein DD-endopeptidase MepM [Granulosicoccus antarcticus IMCC3135]